MDVVAIDEVRTSSFNRALGDPSIDYLSIPISTGQKRKNNTTLAMSRPRIELRACKADAIYSRQAS